MTFSALQNADLGVWTIRCAFYPMVFIYPLQWLFWSFGCRDADTLIFAGRFVVICFSLLNLWLLYRIALRYSGKTGIAIVAVVLLAVSRLHIRLGSTEMPRTVASSFLLLSFWAVLGRRRLSTFLAAGGAFGIGITIRLGEIVFVVPLAITLLRERRVKGLMVMGVAAVATALLALGPADLFFWPEMFSGIRSMIHYSVVERLSSSGYQPFWQYLRIAPSASDLLTIGLFFYGLIAARCRRPAFWTVVPIFLLGFFQMKQERYLIPMLPFFVLCAACGAYLLLERASERPPSAFHLVVLLVLSGAVLFELEGFRPRQPREAVEILHRLAADSGVKCVTMQSNTAAARLYLPPRIDFRWLRSKQIGEAAYFEQIMATPRTQYLVLQTADVAHYGCNRWLDQYKFRPVPGFTQPQYTVYLKKSRRAWPSRR
jgi:hypothetical protein